MRRSFAVVAVLVFALSTLSAGPADQTQLTGYTAENSQAQHQWEEKFRAIPDPAKIREYNQRLSARPHHVGSPYDKDNA